jgi:rfaE bifunctional protein nucleotidyltransferase chain/domain
MINPTNIEVYKSGKILSFKSVTSKVAELRKSGKTVGLCHGGFDLLHPGQVKHFESAKKLCDILFVSVTSDRFVAGRKGEGRPVFPAKLRAYMIAKLTDVDYVFISDFEKGIEVINSTKPDYYIKGPDFIGKQTPGITAERAAIAALGGEMKYTSDPKLSTTEIIDYIKNMERKKLLLIIDRDGTLITNDDFFGQDPDWKTQIKYNNDVISLLSYLQTKFQTTKIVASNQAGVARNYFDDQRVRDINSTIDLELKSRGIKIDSWQFCPDMDSGYVAKNPLKVNPAYVKKTTKRKPATTMVVDGLLEINKSIADFMEVLVIGDRDDDAKLAVKLKAKFIDVKWKKYPELIKAVISL